MRRGDWLPPVLWMAVILWAGSDTGSAEHTGRLILPLLRVLFPAASPVQLDAVHALLRKAGHVVEYAVLAALWVRALRAVAWPRPRAAVVAWVAAVAWAVVDETLQTRVASRTGSVVDVAIDTAGALIVALPAGAGVARAVEATSLALLWIAVVGGSLVLALDLATGVPAGVLWVTIPAAGALLVLRWRRERRR